MGDRNIQTIPYPILPPGNPNLMIGRDDQRRRGSRGGDRVSNRRGRG
jgi:hypothetical protein